MNNNDALAPITAPNLPSVDNRVAFQNAIREMKNMARRTCYIENCNHKVSTDTNTELCPQHDYEAGLENEHVDGLHELDYDCPFCREAYNITDGDMVEEKMPEPTNRKNTSHANCSHEKTKSARAACRRNRNAPKTNNRKINDEVRKGKRTHNPNTQTLYD